MNNHSLVVTSSRLVLPDRVLESGWLRIKDGVIEEISRESSRPEGGIEVLEVEDCSVFPGFIDAHIHGSVGIDTMNANAAQLSEVSRFLARNGMTAWVPTLVPGSVDEYSNAINAIDEVMADANANSQSARVLGVHYEGPFVNQAQCGALHREHFRTYKQPADLEELPVLKTPGAIMMTTMAPEIEGGIDLIKQLRQKGWVVSIGHTRATLGPLDQALAAGARHMTHFMNAMPQLHHREPGPVAWGLSRDEVTCDFIADGIHLDRYVLKLLMKLKGATGLNLISDAIAAAGKGDGDYQVWGETITVKNGRTSNAHGSIAGSVITMLDAIRVMKSLGVSDVEIARMASFNPARLLGVDHECGSIEAGKRADLVAIDAGGDVRMTIVGGEVAFHA